MGTEKLSTAEIASLCYQFLEDEEELHSSLKKLNKHIDLVFRRCFHYSKTMMPTDPSIDIAKFEIESVLDYLNDEVNTGHWSNVPLETRRAFTAASFVKALIFLRVASSENILPEVLKILDLGLLLGAPLLVNHALLTNCASLISKHSYHCNNKIKVNKDNIMNHKRKLETDDSSCYELLNAERILTLECPSLETFNNKHFMPQLPVKLSGCMSHWPAMHKWLDLNYFLKIAGDRTVPVEMGSHYTDENWSQKLVTLKEFTRTHFMSDSENISYLAQHNLFEQIPELKDDIHIPEYCSLSRNYEDDSDVDINAWFGPKGTVSPLHQDPKDNLLAQVFGTKQVLLFSPQDSHCLYPHEDKLLSNTSKVDPLNPNLEVFPLFKKTKMLKCLLEPGEMLFIPEKWWHHVTALDKSFSVSFWWT